MLYPPRYWAHHRVGANLPVKGLGKVGIRTVDLGAISPPYDREKLRECVLEIFSMYDDIDKSVVKLKFSPLESGR